MDIAKIRKKAQSQGEAKRPAEPVHEQAVEPSSVQPADQPSAAADDLPAQPEPGSILKTETGAAGEAAGASGAATGDRDPAAQPAAEAPGPDGGGGGGFGVEEDGGMAELLTFSLAKEEFAFKVSEVEEIIRYQRITLVPTMPEYVAGITSLRGKIIPVIDLRTRLSLKDDEEEAVALPKADADGIIEGTGKIIVLAGPLGLIGAIIDKVLGVVRLPDDVILEPPAHLTEEETKFIEGVVIVEKRFISIIRSADALNIEVG